MDPVRRLAALVALVALTACGTDLGNPGDWISVATVRGRLAAQVGMAPQPPRAQDSTPMTLRVVTFNVETGEDVAKIAAGILANAAIADADVFLLQEEEDYPGEGSPRATRLAEALDLDHVYVPARAKADGTHGLAILSAYPIQNVEEMRLGANNTGRQRIAVRADIVAGGKTLQIVDIHLETLLNITDRLVQLRPAVIDLPDTVLVGGDFNSNRFISVDDKLPILSNSAILDTEQAPIIDEFMTNLGFATPAADVGDTEHMFGVASRLDAIYTRGLVVTPAQVERSVDVSDHWPVWVDVTLP